MSHPIPRRDLLKQAAAVAALGLAGPAAAAKKGKNVSADPTAFPIIDTHQHLWDLDKFRLPWTGGAPKLNRSFVMKDYNEATQGLNVVKTVYMEVDVAPDQQAKEAEYVIDLCRRDDNPMVAAVISGRPGRPGFRDYIRRFRTAREIRGIRQVLHGNSTPAGYCLEPNFVKDIQFLGEQGMSFDLCMRHPELRDATRLVDQCPGTRFILDHCGNPPIYADRAAWERDLAALAERKNVICKVSGIVASVEPGWKPQTLEPVVLHVLKVFGPDRVIFAGDWPVCTLGASFKEWVDAAKWIVRDRSQEEQRKLFHDNAARVYNL
ncbi:MAG: amidohydrolase family protein [Actinomycetota bacterium]